MAESRLDRLIAYFSPKRGADRLSARIAREAMLSYEGARKGRREDGWIVGTGTSANAEISSYRLTLRDRARQLRRNNAYAAKAIMVLVSNRIGTGILCAADGRNKRINKNVNEAWERWIELCDYTGKTDLYGIQSLAEAARIESGECFVRFVPVETEPADVRKGDPGFRLQVLEPDHLDTSRNETLDDGSQIREGIQYKGGVPIAYWLYPTHPGDYSPVLRASTKSVPVPASDILHYYRVQRPGQLTGVTELAPVVRRLYDLEGYADAELMRKKIAACFVGWVTTPTDLPGASLGPTELQTDGKRKEQAEPGMIAYGKPGESATFFDPKPSGDYKDFNAVELHAIAAGLGVPYELLTGDLSEVTYTSHRGGLVQFRGAVEADQWQMVIPQLCDPIWRRFVRDSQMVPGFSIPADFTPPRFGLLDPAKEIPAMNQAIQGGLRSWTDTIRREGDDPAKVLETIDAERKEFARRGISLTSIQQPTEPQAQTEPDEDEDRAAA